MIQKSFMPENSPCTYYWEFFLGAGEIRNSFLMLQQKY